MPFNKQKNQVLLFERSKRPHLRTRTTGELLIVKHCSFKEEYVSGICRSKYSK